MKGIHCYSQLLITSVIPFSYSVANYTPVIPSVILADSVTTEQAGPQASTKIEMKGQDTWTCFSENRCAAGFLVIDLDGSSPQVHPVDLNKSQKPHQNINLK